MYPERTSIGSSPQPLLPAPSAPERNWLSIIETDNVADEGVWAAILVPWQRCLATRAEPCDGNELAANGEMHLNMDQEIDLAPSDQLRNIKEHSIISDTDSPTWPAPTA